MTMIRYKTVIGRAESMDFPMILLSDVPAKIDTGAYLSAIHATDVKEVTRKGKKVLKLTLLGNHASFPYSREIEIADYSRKTIENSFGHKEERYVIKLKVKIAGKVFHTEFTLADRSKKVFPILLGRTLLSKRFIVDTDIAHIDRKLLKVKLKEWLAKDDLSDDEEN
jgi:hypothetical protein